MKKLKLLSLGMIVLGLTFSGCIPKNERTYGLTEQLASDISKASAADGLTKEDIQTFIDTLDNLDEFLNAKSTTPVETNDFKIELLEGKKESQELIINLKVTNLSDKSLDMSPIGVINGYYITDFFGYEYIEAKESETVSMRLPIESLFYLGAKDIHSFEIVILDIESGQDLRIPLFESSKAALTTLKDEAQGAVLVDEKDVKVIAKGLHYEPGDFSMKIPVLVYKRQSKFPLYSSEISLEANGKKVGTGYIFPSGLTRNLHSIIFLIEDSEAFYQEVEKNEIKTLKIKGELKSSEVTYPFDKEISLK